MTPDDYPYASPKDAKAWQSQWPAQRPDASPVVGKPSAGPYELDIVVPQLAIIVAVVVGIAAVGNATMMPVGRMMEPGPGAMIGIAYLCLIAGSIGGQAAVLTVLLVWGPGPLWLRQAWHWGLALVAFSAWTFGLLVAVADVLGPSDYPDELTTALLGLPLIALACQAVPWMFKLYLHWRIELPDETREPAAVQQLSIRDIFLGTIVVAVTMAAVRLGKPANAEASLYWLAWGIGSASAAGISLVCLVPMVYLTLGVRQVRVGVFGVAAIAGTVAATASGILMWINPGGPSDKEIILVMASLATGFTVTLAGTLWIARRYGYRLVTERPLMSPFGPARSETPLP